MRNLATKLLLATVAGTLGGIAAWKLGHLWLDASAGVSVDTPETRLEDVAESADALEFEPGVSALEATAPVFPRSTFRRFALTPEEVVRWLDPDAALPLEYDAFAHFKLAPSLDLAVDSDLRASGAWRCRTNSIGLREDHETLPGRPDLRVLVVGDEHASGACDNDESFANVIEARLRAAHPGLALEVLNAAGPRYGPYQCLGTLERFLALEPDVLIVTFDGGNDFDEGLTLYHAFGATPRPRMLSESDTRMRQALDTHRPCVEQALGQAKYFALHPAQAEVALQMARDVSTEILVTCARNGVQAIFVYLPPFAADAGSDHHATFERAQSALELVAGDSQLVERMADSYLTFLRSLRATVVDLREEGSATEAQPRNSAEHHTLSVAGHSALAERLLPLVEAAAELELPRVRTAPAVRLRSQPRDRAELMSPGAPDPEGALAQLRTLPREAPPADVKLTLAGGFELPELDAVRVNQLFELGDTREFDAQSWFRLRPDLASSDPALHTNSIGLRMERELAAESSAWRVALLGDEQWIGASGAHESAAQRLTERFSTREPDDAIELVDAACPGFGLHNYLGAFERLSALGADHLIVGVNAGNDFDEALRIEQAVGRVPATESGLGPVLADARARDGAATEAFVAALARFAEEPQTVQEAARLSAEILLELARRCSAAQIELTVVFVPSAHTAEATGLAERLRTWTRELDLSKRDLGVLESIAVAVRVELRAARVEVLDLGAAFRELAGPEFDLASLRLDALGHARLAELIEPSILHRARWLALDPRTELRR